jgi:hypothetical protein
MTSTTLSDVPDGALVLLHVEPTKGIRELCQEPQTGIDLGFDGPVAPSNGVTARTASPLRVCAGAPTILARFVSRSEGYGTDYEESAGASAG